jgi:hypothetical protein
VVRKRYDREGVPLSQPTQAGDPPPETPFRRMVERDEEKIVSIQ